MNIDYIAIGAIIISLGIIGYIIFKKFPVIAAINTDTIKKHQQERVKKGLIEDRLKRKIKALRVSNLFVAPAGEEAGKMPVFAKAYDRLKQLEKKYRSTIQELEPHEEEGAVKKIELLLAEAKELIEQEQLKDAEEKYIEAISIDNKYTDAYEGLGELYRQQKDYEHAKDIYSYLLKLSSTVDGESEKTNGNGNGKGESTSSVSINTRVAGYHVDLGEVYIQLDQPDKAMECFTEAIRLEPSSPKILDALIKTALSLKDIETATTYIEKLKEVNPENEKLVEFQETLKGVK